MDTVTLPRQTKGERTRARILAAAAEHFAAVGLDAGSVPEIARQVGVSHATLYQHFGRKDDLFRAAVEDDLTGLFATLTPSLERTDLDADELVGLLAILVDGSRRHPLARRVLAHINTEQQDALRDLPALLTLETQLTAAIAAAQRAHRIRRDIEAAEIAAGLVAVTLPMLVVALRLDGATSNPRAPDAVRFLADSLRPPTRNRPRNSNASRTTTRNPDNPDRSSNPGARRP